MKIRSLVPFAIACMALLTPRLITSGGAFGGGVAIGKLPCDSKNINHVCSGTTACQPIGSTETTSNHAEQYYIEGSDTNDCFEFNGGELAGRQCSGLASKPNSDCKHERVPFLGFRINKSWTTCSPFSLP